MASRPRKTKQPLASNAVDIAFEAVANDPSLDSPARQVLLEQVKLARSQTRLAGWQIAGERAGFALKLLTGLAAVAAAALLGLMIWQAHNAAGLLVEPFSVPPDLAASGLTGEVVATKVLDQIALMQTSSNSFRKPSGIAGDFGDDIQLAIPTTGVNLGELQAALRRWLGHETRISGEVYRTPKGLAVAARVRGEPAFVAEGAPSDVAALTDAVAVNLFSKTQPHRYGRWLIGQGENSKATELYRQIALSEPNPHERAWGYRQWAWVVGRLGDSGQAVRLTNEALKIEPKMAAGWQMIGRHGWLLGHDEAALHGQAMVARYMPRDTEVEDWARYSRVDAAASEEMLGDFAAAKRDYLFDQAEPRQRFNLGSRLPAALARTYIGLHDIGSARALLTADPLTPLDASNNPGEETFNARVQWSVLFGEENWAGLVAFTPQAEAQNVFGVTQLTRVSGIEWNQLAYAKAMLGDLTAAKVMADQTPLDCIRCLILRGRLAGMAVDNPAADRWFADAVKRAPSFPQAASAWGEVKAARGDLAGALAQFREAQKRSPNWADPYKFEGDVLAKQGKTKEALAAYAKAAERAPRWKALHAAQARLTPQAGAR